MKLKITNMHCEACVKLSESALQDLPEVVKVEVKSDGQTTVESSAPLKWDEVKNALAEVGKNAELL